MAEQSSTHTYGGLGRQAVVLFTAAAAAITAGGATVLVLHALERRQLRRGDSSMLAGRRDSFTPLSPRASTAISQRCWEWLDEAEERSQIGDASASPPRLQTKRRNDGTGAATSSSSQAPSWLETPSSASTRRPSGAVVMQHDSLRLTLANGDTTSSSSFSVGWDDVLRTNRPGGDGKPPGSGSHASGSATPVSTGWPALAQLTAAKALISDDNLAAEQAGPGGESSDDSCRSGSDTVRLKELQLYHNTDGSPQLLGRGSFGQVCPIAVHLCVASGGAGLAA